MLVIIEIPIDNVQGWARDINLEIRFLSKFSPGIITQIDFEPNENRIIVVKTCAGASSTPEALAHLHPPPQ
jgi:hypothetical protein